MNNNILIAKFMNNWTDTGQEPAYFVYNHKGYESNELLFHKSWDWLMLVVEKIGGVDNYSINIHWGTGCTDSFAWCTIHDGPKQITSDELNSDEQSLITAVYKTCVEFIKLYNKDDK